MATTTRDVAFQNAGAAKLAAGIATFGQVFQRGEIPSGATLVAKDGAVTVPIQMDVKTRYDDGSVKMAVLAPIPSASVSTAMAVKPGLRSRVRSA